MQDLIAKIEQWAEDRNIIKGSKPIDQAMKLFSEFGELADNVGKGRDCRDDIGDIFVVLTIMAKQLGLSIISIGLHKPRCSLVKKECVAHLALDLSYFCQKIITNNQKNIEYSIEDCLGLLILISDISGYTLEECVQIAYNDIKDRVGILWNGVFVKNTDENYNEVKLMFENH